MWFSLGEDASRISGRTGAYFMATLRHLRLGLSVVTLVVNVPESAVPAGNLRMDACWMGDNRTVPN
jgi:hypothetical protein